MVIVDSSVWIDFFRSEVNEHTVWLEASFGLRPIGLTNLILCEVLQGVRRQPQYRSALKQLTFLPLFDLPGTGLAITAAANYRALRSQGITVRTTIDCLIATFCIVEDFELLHRDRDFDAFEQHLGLVVVKA
ncbi:MAG: type II toxin-antitoxin system VapC family toxin [Terracidiphilus sp.]